MQGSDIDATGSVHLREEEEATVLYLYQRGGRFTADELVSEVSTRARIQVTRSRLVEILSKLVGWGFVYQAGSEPQCVYVVLVASPDTYSCVLSPSTRC